MVKLKLILYTALVLIILPSLLFSQNDNAKSNSDNPKKIIQYLTDETGTLSSGQVTALSQKLRDFDTKTSTQIVVYMIQSLEGESLEDMANRIAEKNKIGKKGKDNGVLLFIAKSDRKIRIEVGYGLEGALTDAVSSQIIRKEIAPSFKNNNFYEGIEKGTDAIISVTKGEYTADKKGLDGTTCLGLPLFIIMIFGIIFFSIFISIIKRIFGFGRGIQSGGRRGGGWSNWGGGGFFGGGSSGSSGGFSGFSGGGGSFGGGGASGGW
jgi:uncharacterized protein